MCPGHFVSCCQCELSVNLSTAQSCFLVEDTHTHTHTHTHCSWPAAACEHMDWSATGWEVNDICESFWLNLHEVSSLAGTLRHTCTHTHTHTMYNAHIYCTIWSWNDHPHYLTGPWTCQFPCCLCRVRKLSDFIINILICAPKITSTYTGTHTSANIWFDNVSIGLLNDAM